MYHINFGKMYFIGFVVSVFGFDSFTWVMQVMNIKSWDLLRYFYDLNDFGRQTFNGGWLSVRIFPSRREFNTNLLMLLGGYWCFGSLSLAAWKMSVYIAIVKNILIHSCFFLFIQKPICLVKVVLANENIPPHPLPSDIIYAVSSNNTRSFQSCTVV